MLTGTKQESILHHNYSLFALVSDPHEKLLYVKYQHALMLYEHTLWVIDFNCLLIYALSNYKDILN